MSSGELKTSKVSFVLRTHENPDVFNTLDEIYLVFTSKSKYPLFNSLVITIGKPFCVPLFRS